MTRNEFNVFERWVMDEQCSLGSWKILNVKGYLPKSLIALQSLSSDQGVRFAAMAFDDQVKDGDLAMCDGETLE